jgi:hypothetical protein
MYVLLEHKYIIAKAQVTGKPLISVFKKISKSAE